MTPDLDPDRRLVLAYAPGKARAALEALWRLDVTLGAVVAGAREKMVARIRLAWWREALERLDAAPPPAEPLLQALAAARASRRGRRLGARGDGGRLGRPARRRTARCGGAAHLCRAAGRPAVPPLRPSAWRGRRGRAGGRPLGLGRPRAAQQPARGSRRGDANGRGDRRTGAWPKRLRPLAMLSLLARRDLARGGPPFERQGSPGRMMRLIRYRLSGR